MVDPVHFICCKRCSRIVGSVEGLDGDLERYAGSCVHVPVFNTWTREIARRLVVEGHCVVVTQERIA